MGAYSGPEISNDGLVFHFDIENTNKSFKGKPTTNILTNNPTIDQRGTSDTLFTTTSSYEAIPFVTPWYYGRYPDSDLDSDGGVRWDDTIKDPLGDYGAMVMKMFPGGNSETQVQQYPNWNIDSSLDYIVSVYCKTTQSNTFRIHINTVKDGSSYWGYASSYHSGNGEWERLSVTVPADQGNTKLRTLRCQGIGSTKTAEAYYKYFQVEQSSFATPFVDGTRSDSDSLLDLTGNNVIIPNVGFDSDNTFTFDGTDDFIDFNLPSLTTVATIEMWANVNFSDGGMMVGFRFYDVYLGSGRLGFNTGNGDSYGISASEVNSRGLSNQMHHYVFEMRSDVSYTNNKIYIDGEPLTLSQQASTELVGTRTFNNGAGSIGRWRGNGSGNLYYQTMDCRSVKIYNRSLTPQEVKNNYLATKSRYGL